MTSAAPAPLATGPALRLRGVSVAFARPVLRKIDLEIPRGCLYGLIGPGASGKSVLLKCLAGLVRPQAGEVEVLGQNLLSLDELGLAALRQRMGMLFQNNALFDFMTVADNIGFPLRQRGAAEPQVRERVAERLASVGLSGFEERLPSRLSGGQKKRVGVARATVAAAELVLYDEPAAGLDPVTSQRIFDLLRAEQRAHGTTVVMVSSDLDRLLPVTDRIGVLLEGKLAFDGSVEGAKGCDDEAVRQFVTGSPDGPL
ncbi:MAG TPA: ATP-binding cassette domain-containing protein [Polyangiaceae bacterium]|nr:ATP-binding cassette domain-containing protein [Polyangiaceae bacterium]